MFEAQLDDLECRLRQGATVTDDDLRPGRLLISTAPVPVAPGVLAPRGTYFMVEDADYPAGTACLRVRRVTACYTVLDRGSAAVTFVPVERA